MGPEGGLSPVGILSVHSEQRWDGPVGAALAGWVMARAGGIGGATLPNAGNGEAMAMPMPRALALPLRLGQMGLLLGGTLRAADAIARRLSCFDNCGQSNDNPLGHRQALPGLKMR